MNLVFVRSGWDTWYRGDGVVGGGQYVDDHGGLGHERYNFQPEDGLLYGYAQCSARSGGLNLRRIDGVRRPRASADGALVVFVATHPEQGGQRVVGWYRNATAFSSWQAPTGLHREDCGYQMRAAEGDGVLLPLNARTWEVPRAAGGMVQGTLRYGRTQLGLVDAEPWMTRIVEAIEGYDGINLLDFPPGGPGFDPTDDANDDDGEPDENDGGGQGFLSSATLRRALEAHAMRRATEHYEAEGWTLVAEYLGRPNPYDLLLERDGGFRRVEVKGTTGDGAVVLVTHGEVVAARNHATDLFIVHSIELDDDGEAAGGVEVKWSPWHPDAGQLTPMAYSHRPPE